jgi:UDP-N-acetylmuramoylalanine--D-glutamate ligase
MTDLAGKRVTVMGLGRFGGGIGVTRYLCAQGADVLVTDLDPPDKLKDSIAQIQPLIDKGLVKLRLGEHNVADFTTCDLIVANAAVPHPWDNRFLRAAEAAKIPITTEISLTIEKLRARGVTNTIAITGSAGKSTTTAMIHHALTSPSYIVHQTSNIVMGGNIGGSLLAELDRITPATTVILELSSAMLYWLDRTLSRKWSPHIAVITNISPNHIDWHGEFNHYAASKRHLIEHQTPIDFAILGAPVWDTLHTATRAKAIRFEAADFEGPLALPGDHNRTNAAGALAACLRVPRHSVAASVAPDSSSLRNAIASFTGLTHRLQLVAQTSDQPPIRFYNDSKSTTPESALKAVEALAAMPGTSRSNIHLIAGGHDKGSDLSPIANLAAHLGGLYTIGVTGPAIFRATGCCGSSATARANVVECSTLSVAVQTALDRLHPGDCLLLSPGCASWDQYVNFESRGDEFITLIRNHLAHHPATA